MNENGDLIGFVNDNDEKESEETTATSENGGNNEGGESSKSGDHTEEESSEVHEQNEGSEKALEAPEAGRTEADVGKKSNGEVMKITDTTTLLLLQKFEEASKERTAISNVVEEKINELKNDVRKVEKKAKAVEAIQVDLKMCKKGWSP